MNSIEWLIEQLQAPCRGIPSHIIEQAKEMHKQEIMNSHKEGFTDAYGFPSKRTAEQYYIETFKNNKGYD